MIQLSNNAKIKHCVFKTFTVDLYQIRITTTVTIILVFFVDGQS